MIILQCGRDQCRLNAHLVETHSMRIESWSSVYRPLDAYNKRKLKKVVKCLNNTDIIREKLYSRNSSGVDDCFRLGASRSKLWDTALHLVTRHLLYVRLFPDGWLIVGVDLSHAHCMKVSCIYPYSLLDHVLTGQRQLIRLKCSYLLVLIFNQASIYSHV